MTESKTKCKMGVGKERMEDVTQLKYFGRVLCRHWSVEGGNGESSEVLADDRSCKEEVVKKDIVL